MITVSTAAVLFAATLAAAVLSCAVSVIKLIDRRRQRVRPTSREMAAAGAGMTLREFVRWLPRRRAPCMAATETEKVARYQDVAHLIRNGDPMAFSGRSFMGLAIRCIEYGDKSHVDLAERTDEGELNLIGALEGEGVTRRSLFEDVKGWPGQVYWGVVHPALDRDYDRTAAVAFASKHIGMSYGYVSLAFQALIHLPLMRELTFAVGRLLWNVPATWAAVCAVGLDKWAAKLTPYCAGFVNEAVAAGGLTLVARRPHYLVGPQDVNQSPAIVEWVALTP